MRRDDHLCALPLPLQRVQSKDIGRAATGVPPLFPTTEPQYRAIVERAACPATKHCFILPSAAYVKFGRSISYRILRPDGERFRALANVDGLRGRSLNL